MHELRIQLPSLHENQRRVVDEADRFNVLMCGRRFGKTLLGQNQAVAPALTGKPVAWFSPTYKMLMEVWRDFQSDLAPLIRKSNVQEMHVELITGGVIDFWSLEKPDAGRGRKYARIIIDEAGIARNLREAWLGAIRPTLTDLKGDAWFLGTPKGRQYFWQLYQFGQQRNDGWRSWRFKSIENPHLSPDEIEAARRDLPEDVFLQEYEGEPADDAGNPFGLQHIAACVGPTSNRAPVVYGLDLAKKQDWLVLLGLDDEGCVCELHRWQGVPWDAAIERIVSIAGTTPVLVDSTGIGDPILDLLVREGLFVEGFVFSAPSKQRLMEGLAVEIQCHRVRFPDGPIRTELEMFEYQITRTGTRYSAPDGMHDDCVCALALAVEHRRNHVGAVAVTIGERATGGADNGVHGFFERARRDVDFGF